jgi:hypothetical protein
MSEEQVVDCAIEAVKARGVSIDKALSAKRLDVEGFADCLPSGVRELWMVKIQARREPVYHHPADDEPDPEIIDMINAQMKRDTEANEPISVAVGDNGFIRIM